jgi:sigma-E factor negative regulatory protein RseA
VNTETMNKESRENLSSFMDGEVDKSAGSFLVRRLANDQTLRATWDRYHLIRDCLRQQDAHLAQEDLCSRVRLAIELEDSQQAPTRNPLSWIRPVAGAAIAASVAMIAILSVGPGRQAGPDAGVQAPVLAAQAESFVSPNIGNVVPASQPVSLAGQSASEQEKTKAYLLRHYQVSGDAGQGFIALVPIVVTGVNASSADNPQAMSVAEDAELPQQ